MSRLIVKNIPVYVTPVRLKEHFLQKDGPGGTITDVKVAHKQDGISRRFAFIGYKSEDEARKAKEWFDRTFLDTTRITVDVVEKGAKDAPAPRPNKRPKLDNSGSSTMVGSSSMKSSLKKNPKDNNAEPVTKSSALEDEFVKVMQPRTQKGPAWLDDVALDGSKVASSSKLTDGIASSSKKGKERGRAPLVGENATNVDDDDAMDEDKKDDGIDDMEWMKRHMSKGMQLEDEHPKEFYQDDDGGGDGAKNTNSNKPTKAADTPQASETLEDGNTPSATILRTARLFLRNLAFSCTESDLQVLFSKHGEVSQVHIPLDPIAKTSKGLAFVTFKDGIAAVQAYETLDKSPFQGRLIHILPAFDRKGISEKNVDAGGNKKSTLKGDKEKERKKNATREFYWSMLYMNSDAVASSIADRMNIPKSEILNPESSDGASAAVKLALAETHIISETKTYLKAEGINLASFSDLAATGTTKIRRSHTCILVKNIPYGTTAQQVREMFEPHGELSRVLVPPAGTIAVVEYVHPDDASKGFKAVAYRRMGSSVVYLEKAPLGIFSGEKKQRPVEKQVGSSKVGAPVTLPEQASGEDVDDNAAPGSTLFVKNLSFATTTDRFTQVFRHLPSFAFARVQTKPDPKHVPRPGDTAPPPRLSMGFGFVGFKSPDAAKKAMSSMHGFVLDGHTLSVKFAGRGAEEDKEEKGKVKAMGTKMVVKNVPFEATKKDIRDLFGAHGQLKSVRLPKKFNTRSRGFAFLDFVSRHEAENVYAALRHTHLLGRHLVLEWAEEGAQDVDALRQKAGVGYGGGAELPGRKRKLDFGEDGDGDEVEM